MNDTYQFTLSEEDKKYALEQLNETEEIREENLIQLRKWLQEEAWIHAKTESKYLLPFLRICKHDLNKTKKKITNFYSMKRDRPEWFENRNPSLCHVEELVKMGIFLPLKQRHENKMVVIIKTAAHDPKIYKLDDIFKAGKMILDLACRDNEYVQLYGVVAIFDMKGISFSHYKEFTVPVIKKVVYAWQNYHVMPKQLEFVRAPTYINVVLNVFRTFMTEKIRNRTRAHFGGLQNIHKFIPKEILPPEYGGTSNETVEDLSNYWYDQLVKNKEWFSEDKLFKADLII